MANLNDILKAAQAAQQQQRQSGFTPPAQAPVQTSAPAAQPQTQATGVQSILDRARQVQQQQRQTTGVQTTVPRTVTPAPTPTPVTTPTTTQPTSKFRSVLEALGIASAQAQRAVTGVQAPVKQQTAETNRIAELLTKPKQEVPATPFKSDKPKTVDSKVKAERDALVAEYNKLSRTSNAMPIVSRRNELRNRIDELTEQLGEEKRAWNWQDAMAYQGNATATRSAANYLDAARNLATIVGQGPALNRYQAAQTAHSRGLISDEELEEARAAYEKSRTTMRDATSGIKGVADRLDTASDQYSSMAQNVEGGTDLGRTALGAYGAGLDLAGDFALNRLLPGLGEYAMYARMYGGGVREQEERGGDEYRSAGKGLVSAISGWASNKLVGGAGNIYGKSAASSAIENAISRVAAKYPVLGNRWVQRIAKGVLNTEGIEEALEDYLNYGADKYLGFDKNATIDKAEVKQDALIGWILGFVATGLEYTPDQKRQIVQDGIRYAKNVETQEQADAAVLQAENNSVQAEQRAEAQAPVIQPTETQQNTNTQETPVQATESISPATDESVPSSTQKLTPASQEELNNGQSIEEGKTEAKTANTPVQQSTESGTIEQKADTIPYRIAQLKNQLKSLKPFTREYEAVEHDIHNYYWDLASSAQEHLDALNQFRKNPDADIAFYDSAEDAQAQYDNAINGLREANLPSLKELRQKAHWVEERVGWAQRKLDKLYDKLDAEGRGQLTEQEAQDARDYEDTREKAKSESEQLNEVCDFLEKHYSEVYGNPGSSVRTAPAVDAINNSNEIGENGNETNKGNEKPGPSSAESNPRRNESNPRSEPKANSGGTLEQNSKRFPRRTAEETKKIRKKRESNSRFYSSRVELDLSMDGANVVDASVLPEEYQRTLAKFKSNVLNCPVIVVRYGNFGPAEARASTDVREGKSIPPGEYAIVLDAGQIADYCSQNRIKFDQALRHEAFHIFLNQAGLTAVDMHTWFMDKVRGNRHLIDLLAYARDAHNNDFHSTYGSPSVLQNVKGGAENVDLNNTTHFQKEIMWNEVFSDLYAGIGRAFEFADESGHPAVDPGFEELHNLALQYFDEVVNPAFRYNEALDEGTETASETAQNPDNKSWADSLTSQESPAENESLEREDDDMTPLNEMDQEREEERRKEQRKETEKRLGKENHKRLSDAYERFKKWADEWTNKFGTDVKDEKGDKVQDDDGNPVKESMLDDFVKNVKDMLDGEMSVQSFQEYYESLKPAEGENKSTDENYFYDPYLAAYLNQFANAERTANLTQTGADAEIARDEYLKQAEAFAGVFDATTKRLSDNFDRRTEMNAEVTENAEREVGGKEGAIRKRINWFKRIQSRPDLFFEALGGFDPKKSKVLYEISNRIKTGEKKLTNVRMGARQFFYDINSDPKTAKAWRDMENGTTNGNVDIMGLGKVSLNYELALLKTLETNGAIDHIAENGAEFPNEADYYAGRNNNGWGDTDHLKVKWTPEALEQMARENLQKSQMMDDLLGSKPKKITFKDIQKEKVRILKDLRKQLKSDVMSSEIGRAAYEASVDSMQYMADEINDVTLRMYGIARALQGPNYWPMTVVGRGNNAQIMNNLAFNVEASSFLQHRKGGSGALHIVPFTEAMNNYITQASNFVAFGELSSDLNMMSKEIGVGYGANDSQKQSIQSVIKKEAGKGAADYLTKWMETINGKPRNTSKFGSKMRSHLAQSSLMLNLGVALKQTPSYFNAMGVIDPDILIKNRLMTFGALRSAKSYANNPLIQALNSKTNVLSSRRVGYNTVEMGEAIENSRSFFGKLKSKLPGWINAKDYSTVANLALACGEQVKRNNPNLDTKSDEFYQKTAELLEEAVVKTQPIYDAQFRPEYLRSDSEIVRMLSMFRTQQSQNYNNLVEAWGEYQAAKNGDAETKQAAETKLKNVVTGQAVSTLAFSLLSTVARLVTHRTKDYEDEDGNFDFGKLAKRVGLDFLESAASLVWFGDVASKVAIDIGSNLAAKGISAATGNKVSGTNEFFSISDNTISLINTFASSAIALAKNPTSPKAIKNAIFDGSQAAGIPTRNAYNLLNSVVMYGYDAIGENDGNYDDMIDMWVTEGKMSDATRATRTTEAAVDFFKKGDRNKANTLLGTLDYSNSDVMSSVKKALGAAYVDGDLSEDEYRRVLKNYIVPTTGDKIDDIIHDKNVDKAVAQYTENDPRKYNALIKAIDSAKKKTGNTSKSDAVARLIIDSAMEKNGRDAFMEKYTTSSYWTAYKAAEKQTGSSNRAVEALLGIDKNKDDTFSQDELYKFYLDNPKNFHLVQSIWDANGWSTSWNDYYKSKSRRLDYDRMASEKESVTTFAEAEAKLKELQSGARITLQKTDVDREMFDTILDLDMSDEDTDTTVNRYLSSGNRNNYNTLRGAGQSPEKSIEILKGIDTDEKGTISQKEMWAYYKAHPEDEAAIEALFNAQGYTGKTTKNWATFKKAKH